MSIEKRAVELHNSGYNCAQSVFDACCGCCGVDEKTALAIGAGFGGGAGCGELCGAISGGIMAIGAAFDGSDPQNMPKIKKLRDEFVENIRSEYGAVTCRDLKSPERAGFCDTIIARCAGLADEMIHNNK